MKITLTHRKRNISFVAISLLLLSPVLISGCSGPGNPDGRQNVSGTITLNDAPLKAMSGIVFSPAVEGSMDGGQGQIINGAYALTGADGVKPGKYIVRITANMDFDKSTGKPADETCVFGNEVSVDVLPAEFNKESTIEFEVVEGKNNVFDYNIKTDFVPTMPKDAKTKEAIPL